MYIEAVPNRNSKPAILLRESYRDENGKVKKRTIANLSSLKPAQVESFRAVLKGAHASDKPLDKLFEVDRSLAHGNVAAVLGKARQIGLPKLLGRACPERQRALALVAGRILFPGSKLALAARLNPGTATCTLGEELGLGTVDEHGLYAAMRWLFERQGRIEQRLAREHLQGSSVVLYDLSSTCYEGSACPLAELGYNRDGKRGQRQINFGLLCDARGCPVAVEVFPGSAADPSTVHSQIDKLRGRFGLEKVTVVGDRGMLTSARVRELEGLEGVGWISALRAPQIRQLAEEGTVQPELFDEFALAEVTSGELFPGERLVVCRNPAVAAKRSRKREDLLAATEAKLAAIAAACARPKRPFRGKDRIARRIEREAGKYKMLKHFETGVTENSLTYARDEASVAAEAALDGFYVLRAGRVSKEEMDAAQIARTYKSLSGVERAFRAIKTTSLNVRPIFHRDGDMVRAHVFICMLAYHVQWHMERDLKPVLFHDEEPGGAPRPGPVHPATRSASGDAKAATKKAGDGLPVLSFRGLLDNLASLARNTIKPNLKGVAPFFKVTNPTDIQTKALKLLGVTPSIRPPETRSQ